MPIWPQESLNVINRSISAMGVNAEQLAIRMTKELAELGERVRQLELTVYGTPEDARKEVEDAAKQGFDTLYENQDDNKD